MLLSDVYLSVASVGPKSRTEAIGRPKIGTQVAHVTRDGHHIQGVSRSPGRFTHRSLNAWRCEAGAAVTENVLAVGNYCYVASARRRWGAHGGEWRGISCRHAHSLLFVCLLVYVFMYFYCDTWNKLGDDDDG